MAVTFTVGGLSAVNAVAGAYSDDLPMIVISGGPNSNDFASTRILHHTMCVFVCEWNFLNFDSARQFVQIYLT